MEMLRVGQGERHRPRGSLSPSGRTGLPGWRGCRTPAARGSSPERRPCSPSRSRETPVRAQHADLHPVLRERARLVRAQHRGRPEGLHRRHPAREHPVLGDAPCSEGEKDREHDGELFRQHRHCQGDAGEDPLQPVPAREAVHNDQDTRRAASAPDEDRALTMEAVSFCRGVCSCSYRLQSLPDPPDLRVRSGGLHDSHPLAVHDQGAGVDEGGVLSARPLQSRLGIAGGLAHGRRFTRQQRLVDRKIDAPEKERIRRHPVPFGKNDEVPARHFPARRSSAARLRG